MPVQSPEPIVDRPNLPKDYGVPEHHEGTLPWSWAEEMLSTSYQVWLATVRPDNRPHAIPIWGAYVDGAIYVEGAAATRWAKNLAHNPVVVVHVERGKEVVSVEGRAEHALDVPDAVQEAIKEQYRAKYPTYVPEFVGWKDEGGFWRIILTVAWGWNGENFPKDMTRWTFTG